jgi:hypothetical protein
VARSSVHRRERSRQTDAAVGPPFLASARGERAPRAPLSRSMPSHHAPRARPRSGRRLPAKLCRTGWGAVVRYPTDVVVVWSAEVSANVLRFPKPREPTDRAAKGFPPPFTSLHFHRPRWQGRVAAAAGNACYLKYRALHLSTRNFGRPKRTQSARHPQKLVARHRRAPVGFDVRFARYRRGPDSPQAAPSRRWRSPDHHYQNHGSMDAIAGCNQRVRRHGSRRCPCAQQNDFDSHQSGLLSSVR